MENANMKLKDLILERCLTSKDMATVIGVSERTLKQKINGKSMWKLKECILISNYFNVKIKDIFL